MKPDVSVCLVTFNNMPQISQRLVMLHKCSGRLNLEILSVNSGGDFRGCIDNTSTPWVSPGIDRALAVAKADVFVYVCGSHGRSNNRAWLPGFVNFIRANPRSLCGHLEDIGCGPAALGMGDRFPDDDPAYRRHIQGGVWGANTDFVRTHCKTDARFPHGYEDVVRSWQVMNAGGTLADYAPIYSTGVRGRVCPNPTAYEYIHDYYDEAH